jgi:hypothetical protein
MRLQSTSSRWLAGVAAVVVVLIVASVVVALVNRQRQSDLFPEDTPEGTVQRYLQAMEKEDTRGAYDYLGSDLRQYCTYQHFRDNTQYFETRDMRVSLEKTEPLDGTVEVRVRVTQVYFSPPFNSSESTYSVNFTLEKEGDLWRFSRLPWPLGWCPGLDRTSEPKPPPEVLPLEAQ